MADQGILGQSKPAAATDTVLYRAPITSSASTALTVANDGTGAAYSVAVKKYDQKLTLDASTYKLHRGDLVTDYLVEVDTDIALNTGFNPGTKITSVDKEKEMYFERFYVPATTSIFVKALNIRSLTLEAVSTDGFQVGETITVGASPNTTTAVVYGVGTSGANTLLYVGDSTIGGTGGGTGTGGEFGDSDQVTGTGGGTGTIATGGIADLSGKFVFSTTTAGGVYDIFLNTSIPVFNDRAYRFDVSDSSMSGRDFKLSTTENGEWGLDNTAGTGDDGTEYTTGKTTSGTAGSANAYVQYDFDGVSTGSYYYYDGGTGTPGNSSYGDTTGAISTTIQLGSSYTYPGFYAYDLEGTWVNSSDTFIIGGTTYTVTGQTAGPYGYVEDYTGTTLTVIKGVNSQDFAGTDTFLDAPLSTTASRSTVTVSSVDVATAAVEGSNYITVSKTNAANNVDKYTSLVVGPGEVVVVNSATQNNVFSLVGFEDASTSFTARVFGSAGSTGSGAGSEGGGG